MASNDLLCETAGQFSYYNRAPPPSENGSLRRTKSLYDTNHYLDLSSANQRGKQRALQDEIQKNGIRPTTWSSAHRMSTQKYKDATASWTTSSTRNHNIPQIQELGSGARYLSITPPIEAADRGIRIYIKVNPKTGQCHSMPELRALRSKSRLKVTDPSIKHWKIDENYHKKFKHEEQIGNGARSHVFRTYDPTNDKMFAVKEIYSRNENDENSFIYEFSNLMKAVHISDTHHLAYLRDICGCS
jgi:hypothetical protein